MSLLVETRLNREVSSSSGSHPARRFISIERLSLSASNCVIGLSLSFFLPPCNWRKKRESGPLGKWICSMDTRETGTEALSWRRIAPANAHCDLKGITQETRL